MADRSWPIDGVVRAAQDGDPDAIGALVLASHPHVTRFAFSLCASPQDAEDAAQEALIILYRKIGTLRASAALASWMYTIVKHECWRRARLLSRHAPAPDEGAGGSTTEDDVMALLEADRVAAAVAALPPDQRRVLILRDVQGHSGREVAQALGLSTAAMKSRLHRARAAVREQLADPGHAGRSAPTGPSS